MAENEFRYADFEYRQAENGLGIVTGTIIRYGDVAKLPWGTEEFKAGAFGDLQRRTVYANRMHMREQPLGWLGTQLTIDDDDQEQMKTQAYLAGYQLWARHVGGG